MQLRAQLWTEARAVLDEFIHSQFVPGVDFGTIIVKGKATKPTLFKPGAEKVCALYGWTARFARDRPTYEMFGSPPGLVCYVCRLIDQAGQIIGEGRGAAKLSEGTDHSANQVIKKAQKRAKVDAVLSAAQLSEWFTQDLEDDAQQGEQTAPDGRVFGARQPDAPDEQWAEHRVQRDQLTREIEVFRVKLDWSEKRFGQVCMQDYHSLVAVMQLDQVQALHERMRLAVEKLADKEDQR